MTQAQRRRLVVERADSRCESCRLPQRGQAATSHIDHVWPRAEGGGDDTANLALACPTCSLRKGRRTEALDPETGDHVEFFDPRTMDWYAHYTPSVSGRIEGRTPVGRAAVVALRLNDGLFVQIRRELRQRGQWP